MKECIFWDSEDNKFISWEEVTFTKDKDDDFIIVMKEIDPTCSEGRNFKSFDYIGLNDISDNKIYADCSIVEFEYWSSTNSDKEIIRGYFKYLSDKLQYVFVDLKDSSEHYFFFLGGYVENHKLIKIIDTIQENKLGLIKE